MSILDRFRRRNQTSSTPPPMPDDTRERADKTVIPQMRSSVPRHARPTGTPVKSRGGSFSSPYRFSASDGGSSSSDCGSSPDGGGGGCGGGD